MLIKIVIRGLLAISIFFGFYNFLVVPKLIIHVTSNTEGKAQLFYKINAKGSYSEQYTELQDMQNGTQILEYNIPSYDDLLRWDPVDSTFSIEINKIYIKVLPFKIPIVFNSISGSNQIKNIIQKDNKIVIDSLKDVTDPQLFFSVDAKKIEFYRVIVSLTLTLFIASIIKLYLINREKIIALIIYIEEKFENKIKDVHIDSLDFKLVGIFSAIGIFAHIFEISNFMLSIDDEYSAFRIRPEAWIWDGRWTAYLIEGFLFPQPTMPYIPNLIASFLMAFSYILILKSHSLQLNWKVYITYPIFIVFPTLWFINEFYGNMVVTAFGFLFVSLSVFILSYRSQQNNMLDFYPQFKNSFLPAILLALSIGAYQSFLMLFIAMGTGIVVLRSIIFKNEEIFIPLLASLRYLSIIFVQGIIFYSILNYFFKYIFPSDYNYVGNFLHFNELINNPFVILKIVLREMRHFYTGSIGTYGVSLWAVGLLSVLSSIILLFTKTNIAKHQVLILFIILLFSPFLLNFITGGNYLPSRSLVALPYVMWLMSIILLSVKTPLKLLIALIILIFVNIQILATNGQYAASASLAQSHDRMMADDLYRRIAESNPKFDATAVSIVDVYGWQDFKTIYPSPSSSTMGASFFNWDQGNVSRMLAFMQLLGYENLQVLDRAKCKTFNEEFEKMPIWPAKDSVRLVNDVYLIKLGNIPDMAHKD